MPNRRVDYAKFSKCYDELRVSIIQDTIDFCLSRIIALGKISKGSRVLDVGCGTGIYTIPLAIRTRALVVGLDSSRDMIEQAKKKEDSQRVDWRIGDAEELPFENASFDCVFMTMVLHQIASKRKAVDETHRVLKENGRLVIMTKSHGQLRRAVINRYFPKTLRIDLERFPSIPKLKDMLLSAGFKKTCYHTESAEPAIVSIRDFLERTRKKFISTLALLDEGEFQRGLTSLKKD
jgi:SAM-dependent methyltransferase